VVATQVRFFCTPAALELILRYSVVVTCIWAVHVVFLWMDIEDTIIAYVKCGALFSRVLNILSS
jgi:hypothetical protein